MSTNFLERLEQMELPEEFKEAVNTIKLWLSTDEDLNRTYQIDNKVICFTKIGESANLHVYEDWDEESEYPLLVVGF